MTFWEILFMSIIGGFFSIIVFCTVYNGYLKKRRRSSIKSRPKSTVEQIVGAFSVAGELMAIYMHKSGFQVE